MNCKYCQAELEEDNSVCPVCGKDNAEPEAEETVTAAEIAEEATEVTAQVEEPAEAEAACEECAENAEESADETAEDTAEESAEPAEEAAVEAPKKKKTWLVVGLLVMLLVAAAAALWYGINGGWMPRPNDVTNKDSYTVEDEKALKKADKVVATVNGQELTNGELQIYYWAQVYDYVDYYYSYLSMLGMDLTKGLDEQTVVSGDQTWQQYFLDISLETWHRYQALNQLAIEAGYELDPELAAQIEAFPESMEQTASYYGFNSAEEMLQAQFGPGCTMDDYVSYMYTYYNGLKYFSDEYEKLDPTEDEIKAYFEEHAADFEAEGVVAEDPLVDVRHILVTVESTTDENGDVVYTEEAWEAARTKAQSILDEWLAGDMTEDSFAELANTYSEDTGSNTVGGLYEGIFDGWSVENFNSWCFDESRVHGDYGMVENDGDGYKGIHIMFFVGRNESWYVYGRDGLLSQLSDDMITQAMERFPMEVTYRNIVLGNVDLAG